MGIALRLIAHDTPPAATTTYNPSTSLLWLIVHPLPRSITKQAREAQPSSCACHRRQSYSNPFQFPHSRNGEPRGPVAAADGADGGGGRCQGGDGDQVSRDSVRDCRGECDPFFPLFSPSPSSWPCHCLTSLLGGSAYSPCALSRTAGSSLARNSKTQDEHFPDLSSDQRPLPSSASRRPCQSPSRMQPSPRMPRGARSVLPRMCPPRRFHFCIRLKSPLTNNASTSTW